MPHYAPRKSAYRSSTGGRAQDRGYRRLEAAPRPRRRRFPMRFLFVLFFLLLIFGVGLLLWQSGTLPLWLGINSSSSASQEVSAAQAAISESTPMQAAEPTPSLTPEPTPSPTPEPTPPPIYDDSTDGYMSGGLCIYNQQAFELFYGSDEMASTYAAMISEFAAELPGMQVYDMVVPNHSEFGLPERVRDHYGCTSQRQNTSAVYDNLSDAVTAVDIYDVLNLHNNENIYFGTDTHWAPLGAYYAYTKFCSVSGVETVPLDRFNKTTYEDFTGYLAYATGENVLYEHPDTLDVYDPTFNYDCEMSTDGINFFETDYINMHDEGMGYSMYLTGDMGCVHITNHDVSIGRKLVIVKDSYGNALAPFLSASFDETFVVDFRYFGDSFPSFCTANGVTDVLFFNNVMSANTPAQHDTMRGMF